jgi:hypothetical protein
VAGQLRSAGGELICCCCRSELRARVFLDFSVSDFIFDSAPLCHGASSSTRSLPRCSCRRSDRVSLSDFSFSPLYTAPVLQAAIGGVSYVSLT